MRLPDDPAEALRMVRATRAKAMAKYRNRLKTAKIWCVYGLYDGTSSKPFYIGCSKNTEQRLKAHASAHHTKVGAAIKKIRSAGRVVRLEIISRFSVHENARARERALINTFKGLINVVQTDDLTPTQYLDRLAAMNRARVQRFRDRKRATKSTKSSVPKNNRSIASER